MSHHQINLGNYMVEIEKEGPATLVGHKINAKGREVSSKLTCHKILAVTANSVTEYCRIRRMPFLSPILETLLRSGRCGRRNCPEWSRIMVSSNSSKSVWVGWGVNTGGWGSGKI